MKRVLVLLLALVVVGCISQQRLLYNSLATIEVTTTASYSSYLDLVVSGKLPTNSVPEISMDYNNFKAIWSAAVVVAQWNTNSVSPPAVTAASSRVIGKIEAAKGGK